MVKSTSAEYKVSTKTVQIHKHGTLKQTKQKQYSSSKKTAA
jgi:hypothetical protein